MVLREEAELRHITQILQPAPFLSAKRAPPTPSTQPSTSFVVITCNPQLSAPQKQSQIKMSQIATAVIVEAAAVAIATENANPNAESMAVLKAKDVEHPICTDNLRSETSTPVKDVLEAQLVATNQPAGNCLIFVEPVELNFRRSNLIFPI